MRTDGKGEFKSHRWTLAKTYFTFEVMACSDAQIMLAHIPGSYDSEAYRIDLGTEGNKKTTITKLPAGSDPPPRSVDTPGILNCTGTKPFWITIGGTSFVIGQGPVGMNVITSFDDISMLKLNEIALATTNSKEGYWLVRQSAGTSKIYSFNYTF